MSVVDELAKHLAPIVPALPPVLLDMVSGYVVANSDTDIYAEYLRNSANQKHPMKMSTYLVHRDIGVRHAMPNSQRFMRPNVDGTYSIELHPETMPMRYYDMRIYTYDSSEFALQMTIDSVSHTYDGIGWRNSVWLFEHAISGEIAIDYRKAQWCFGIYIISI